MTKTPTEMLADRLLAECSKQRHTVECDDLMREAAFVLLYLCKRVDELEAVLNKIVDARNSQEPITFEMLRPVRSARLDNLMGNQDIARAILNKENQNDRNEKS